MVKMPPADGSICGAEVLEVEKCMMPECREYTDTWWAFDSLSNQAHGTRWLKISLHVLLLQQIS